MSEFAFFKAFYKSNTFKNSKGCDIDGCDLSNIASSSQTQWSLSFKTVTIFKRSLLLVFLKNSLILYLINIQITFY